MATTAKSGDAGVQSMKDHGADVVIIDKKLPDGDGIKYAKKLKKQYPETRFLIIGKKFSASDRKFIIDTRGVSCLTRPYTFQRFSKKISVLLEDKKDVDVLLRGMREKKQKMAEASRA